MVRDKEIWGQVNEGYSILFVLFYVAPYDQFNQVLKNYFEIYGLESFTDIYVIENYFIKGIKKI